jgi:hypothetical protein
MLGRKSLNVSSRSQIRHSQLFDMKPAHTWPGIS